MTRPTGPLPTFATDELYDDPGRPWDGYATKVALTADELAQGFQPTQRLPAPKLAWKLNQIDKWLEYLDGIEARNWDSGSTVWEPIGPTGYGVGTTLLRLVPLTGALIGTGLLWGQSGITGMDWLGDGTGGAVNVWLYVNEGEVIVGLKAYINPATHAAFPGGKPANMPKLTLLRKGSGQSGTSDTLWGVLDPSSTAGAYNPLHSFGLTGFFHEVQTSAATYAAVFEDESGANALAGLHFDNLELELRDTAAITLYDTPGVIASTGFYSRHAFAYNAVRPAFVGIVVAQGHVTTPVIAGAFSASAWEAVVTGLAAPTLSTTELTFNIAVAGTIATGVRFGDGTHVWSLDTPQAVTAGTQGPFPATIVGNYYGPITSPGNAITTVLTPIVDASGDLIVSAVNDDDPATPGTDPLGGLDSSIAIDSDGGAVANPGGVLWYWTGPYAGVPENWSLVADAPSGVFYDVVKCTGLNVYIAAGGTDENPGDGSPQFVVITPSNTQFATAVEVALPNQGSYFADTGFVAGSADNVAIVFNDGGTSNAWHFDGATAAELGALAITGKCTALEYSETDSLFLMGTDAGRVYTSPDGTVWSEPMGAILGDSISHAAVVGGSWVLAGRGQNDVLLALWWSGDQGRSWRRIVPPWPQNGGTLVSLIALDGGFGAYWLSDTGVAKLYRSLSII